MKEARFESSEVTNESRDKKKKEKMRKHIYIYEIVNKETTGNSGKSKNEGPERLIQK